jgi:hypothetical protein
MFRRLRFVAVPVLLILLTAGVVQARPLHVQASPASLWGQVWQLLSRGTWIKEGIGADPNGSTPHSAVVATRGRGAHPNRGPIGR